MTNGIRKIKKYTGEEAAEKNQRMNISNDVSLNYVCNQQENKEWLASLATVCKSTAPYTTLPISLRSTGPKLDEARTNLCR